MGTAVRERQDDRATRSLVKFVVGSALAATVALGGGFTPVSLTEPADAAPPAVTSPSDLAQIWSEDFESSGPGPIPLASYAAPVGPTYTATPYWLDETMCNGIVMSFNSGATPPCPDDAAGGTGSRQNMQRLADILGQLRLGVAGSMEMSAPAHGSTAGTDPIANSQANHAVAEVTKFTDAPENEIEFGTTSNVALPAFNRFLALSLDIADVSCGNASGGAMLAFSFVDGAGDETMASSTPHSVCDDPGRRFFASLLPAGVPDWLVGGGYGVAVPMQQTTPALGRGNSVGIRMRNQALAGAGNDHAFDNLAIYDATPSLSQSFSPP